jgi:hypothetical protein
MFGLTRLLASLTALATALEDLAGTVATANAGLRGRLQLDTVHAESAVLERQPLQDRTEGTHEADGPAGRPRGRRKGTHAA